MTTSINGLVLPIETEATQFPDSVQGVKHDMQFTLLGNSGFTENPDFTQLVGLHDFTTGQSVGNQETFALPGTVSFFNLPVYDNVTVDYSNSTAAISIDMASNPQ